MTDSGKVATLRPERVGKDHRFQFRCHKEISCFTECCRGINITLTPYDIIRLKKRLDLPSDQFLALYTQPQLLAKTDLPVVTLKHIGDERESCPFVREDGCIVYEDRPGTCRYYPLGVASMSRKTDVDGDDFFFFVEEPHCKGHLEEKEWTVGQWRVDQGVDTHDDINAEWTDLIVRKRSFPSHIRLTEQSKRMFFLISYNIDRFRDFVFESSFLSRYPQSPETTERIRRDDTALFTFGIRWLRDILFDENRFIKTKDGRYIPRTGDGEENTEGASSSS